MINYGQEYVDYATLTYPVSTATGSVSSGSLYVKSGEGIITSVMVTAAANTPTLYVYDNSSGTIIGGTAIVASFTPVAGTLYSFGERPIKFTDGLYVGSTGSVGCTICYA